MPGTLLKSAILVVLAALLGVGCSDDRYGRRVEDQARALHEGWQVRWGDSPRREDGVFLWTVEGHDDAAWKPHRFPEWPVREDEAARNLWQRVRLPEIPPEGQTLLLTATWQILEAYVGERKIYAYGELDAEGKGYFPGPSWHFLDLGPEDSGRWLSLRVYSNDVYIGAYDHARLGSRGDHIIWMLKRDLALIVMGFIYVFLGLVTLFIFTKNTAELTNVSFGLFSIAIGVYELCRTFSKQLVFHDPVVWSNVELTALYAVPVTFYWFVEHLLGPGRFQYIRRLKQVSMAFMAAAWTGYFIAGETLWWILYAWQRFFLVAAVMLIITIGWAAIRGRNPEVRFFFAGVAVCIVGAVHDVMASIGWIEGFGVVNHIAMCALISSLALIVGRRYFITIGIRKNLELASAVQQLLLPKEPAGKFAGFTYASFYKPHGRMSGDWMNFWVTATGERRLLFGDVIGKGPRAALAAAAIAAFIEDAKVTGEDVEACIRRINGGLLKLFDSHITSTFSAAALHEDGTLDLYNCGGVGWLKLGEKCEHWILPSSMLGFDVENLVIGRRQVKLAPGETVLAFTDGVLEGTRPIIKLLRSLQAKDAARLPLEELFAECLVHRDARAEADDRSIIVVRRDAPSVQTNEGAPRLRVVG